MTESFDERCVKLNTQTGKVLWPEIQGYFARGVVLVVAAQADLVKVAADVIDDNQSQVGVLLASGVLKKASIEDARSWQENDPLFWAIVAAPWVLVQELEEKGS